MQHADKNRASKSESHSPSGRTSALGISQPCIDISPEATTQRQLAQTIAQSPNVVTKQNSRTAIHNSPRMLTQRQQLQNQFGAIAQLKANTCGNGTLPSLAGPTPQHTDVSVSEVAQRLEYKVNALSTKTAQRQRSAQPLVHLDAEALQCMRDRKFQESEEEYSTKRNIYLEHVAKGRKAWDMLQEVLTNEESQDVQTKADFVKRYGVTEVADSEVPSPAKSRIENKSGFLSLDTGKKGEKETAYRNSVNPLTGVIVGESNYAEKDPGVGRLPNSEILYHQYKMAMEVNEKHKGIESGSLSNLNKIVRNSIQGANAITVLDMCSMKMNEKLQGKTFMPGEDDFFAILGTDNGKSAAFLLKDHPNEVGWKTITNITASQSWIEINIGA